MKAVRWMLVFILVLSLAGLACRITDDNEVINDALDYNQDGIVDERDIDDSVKNIPQDLGLDKWDAPDRSAWCDMQEDRGGVVCQGWD